MYISYEGMVNAGLNPGGTPLDMDRMMQQNREMQGRQMQNMTQQRSSGG